MDGGEKGMKEYIMRYENEVLQLLPDKIQPLVRCKDCKWNSGKPNTPYCQIRSEPHRNDWFCADGERKEGR